MKKIILTAILSLLTSAPAIAQSDHIFIPPGTDYDNTGAKVHQYLKQQSFATTNKIPAGVMEVSIVNPDYLEADQFGLLLKKSNSVTGCAEYSPLEYEATYIENYYMDIEVKHYRRDMTDTQNATYDCDKKSKVISGMVVLSVSDLRHKGVKKIRFNNGEIRDTYNVSSTPTGIRLTPESMTAFKAQNLKGVDKTYIEYNIPDTQIVKLQVPMAHKNDNIKIALNRLAKRHSLEPVMESATLDLNAENNVFYFKDINGKTSQEMNSDGYTEIGTIKVRRPFDGPNGRMAKPVTLKVFLTKTNVTL